MIYWWTSTEIDRDHACYITDNGFVIPLVKKIAPGDLAFRCVCEPSKLSVSATADE